MSMKRYPEVVVWAVVFGVIALGPIACRQTTDSGRDRQRGETAVRGVQKERFGETEDGEAVDLYTLRNRNGLVAKVTNYGATLTELHVPDRNGELVDVVLGFDNLEQYLRHRYYGSTLGRVANRIAEGRFTLDGNEYTLAINAAPNHLHGGDKGFDKVVWQAEPVDKEEGPAVRFAYLSPDGEEGYPGNLQVEVTYTLTHEDALRIDYRATTDRATPVNLSHHSYFNLSGAGNGDVRDHVLEINADHYTPPDENLIPTGEIAPVAGTPFDLRSPTAVGEQIDQLPGGGYDENFVLNDRAGEVAWAARLYSPRTGVFMELLTDQPSLQLYTGNHLDGTLVGKQGKAYPKHAGLCLEAQHPPDAINQPAFPSVVLRPGETYTQTTIHRFDVRR
jgi:aldose 1-epimerase